MTTATVATTIASNRYSIEIDSVILADFQEVSEFSIERPTIEQKVSIGGGEILTRKYPGKPKYSDITLKIALGPNKALYDWISGAVNNNSYNDSLKSGAILQLDVDPQKPPVRRWNFENAWPSKWTMAAMKAGSSDVVIESLTMTVGRIWIA